MPTETSSDSNEVLESLMSYDEAVQAHKPISASLNALTDVFTERIAGHESILETIEEEGDIPQDPQEYTKFVASKLEQALPPDIYSSVASTIEELGELYVLDMAYSAKIEQLAEQQLQTEKEGLYRTINWEAVIGAYTEQYNSNFDVLLGQLNEAHLGPRHAINQVRSWKNRFVEEGYALSESATPDNDAEKWLTNGNLAGALQDWMDLTREAIPFLSIERTKAARVQFYGIDHKLQRLQQFAKKIGLDGQGSTHVPGVVAKAIETHAATHIMAFDAHEQEVRQAQLAQMPNSLFIENTKKFTEHTGINDVPRWVDRSIDGFPAWFTRGIGAIHFTEDYHHAYEEKVAANTKNPTKTSGIHRLDENRITIDAVPFISEVYVKKMQEVTGEDSAKIIRDKHLERTRETLDHELTHHAHAHTIPFEWLRDWVATTKNDPVAVTDYVARMRGEEGVSPAHPHAQLEDLTESCLLYQNDPGLLLTMSPGRFDDLNTLLGAYDEAVVKNGKKFLLGATSEPAKLEIGLIWSGAMLQNRHDLKMAKLQRHYGV